MSSRTGASAARRFWDKVDVGDEDDCWPWTGSHNGLGYGQIVVSGRRWYAHRYSYTTLVGPIPDGLEIDHLCRNPGCVNPAHLEAVTHQENVRRGDHVTNSAQRSQTHCKHGHEFTPENTYIIPSTGARHCRACRTQWHREGYAKIKARRAA